MSDETWMDSAACKGMNAAVDFFPERSADVRPAKAVCKECPVQEPCLHYALTRYNLPGVWGGTSERERRKMRRQSRATGYAKCACGAMFPTQGLARSCDSCREQAAIRRARQKNASYKRRDHRASV